MPERLAHHALGEVAIDGAAAEALGHDEAEAGGSGRIPGWPVDEAMDAEVTPLEHPAGRENGRELSRLQQPGAAREPQARRGIP